MEELAALAPQRAEQAELHTRSDFARLGGQNVRLQSYANYRTA